MKVPLTLEAGSAEAGDFGSLTAITIGAGADDRNGHDFYERRRRHRRRDVHGDAGQHAP